MTTRPVRRLAARATLALLHHLDHPPTTLPEDADPDDIYVRMPKWTVVFIKWAVVVIVVAVHPVRASREAFSWAEHQARSAR